jgi:hypothetical protein
VLVLAPAAFAQQPTAAGRIKVVSGSAFIVRSSGTVAARAGDEVFASDALQTGADGSLGVTLKDDTRLSLGPSSEVRLERYAYAPDSGALGMVLNFVRGMTACVWPDREDGAGFDSSRNSGRDCRRPRDDAGDQRRVVNVKESRTQRRASMNATRLMALTAVIAGSLEVSCAQAPAAGNA